MTDAPVPEGRLRLMGTSRWYLQCPKCGKWGGIDDDQLHGRVSVDHTRYNDGTPHDCTFHETRDWFASARPEGQPAIEALGR